MDFRASSKAVNRKKLGTGPHSIDCSADAIFPLRGSGYAEAHPCFRGPMSDFSFIGMPSSGGNRQSCRGAGLAENIPGRRMPMFRNSWRTSAKTCQKGGAARGGGSSTRLSSPLAWQTALGGRFYGHTKRLQSSGKKKKGIKVWGPPASFIVCQNNRRIFFLRKARVTISSPGVPCARK